MQLDLGTDPRTEILRRMHDRLIDEFGRVIRPDDERRDPIWTLVQGVIGARAKTAVSNANTDRLIAAYGTWDKVAEEELSALTAALKTATFPAMAAERLKACLQNIIDQRGRATLDHLAELDTAEAMEWLEQLPGVARKISAGVMNTSHFNRRALVLDAGHRRVAQRMGLVPAKADTARAFDALMLVLPPEWSAEDIDEHHMLGKRLAQTICRPKQPHCEVCPVRSDCDHGR
ncbi:MAG: endonuclease III [Sphingomonadales bacterium]|nr:endonuclease III [Sphingomonadales bacterium]PIX64230.1 MAG: endonuclease III [Sphingomonadales bacterium CG_4_10_14_3_um_filter_58_15]NCO50177.1 endonuclease III [Sphingomonadales bacterium]NCP00260.1 endonuclease III [Sphingomonadales bacterium]NCP27732.1 endonuclease III [Sphingomonadales bacterium]